MQPNLQMPVCQAQRRRPVRLRQLPYPARLWILPREKISVTTDLFKAVLDSQGGTLARLELNQYQEYSHVSGLVDKVKSLVGTTPPPVVVKPVVLMEDDNFATRYVAQTGLLNTKDAGDSFPNHLTLMKAPAGDRVMADGDKTLEVTFESQPVGGLKYLKTYVFTRGDYSIRVKHQVVNVGEQPQDAQLYLQLVRHGTVCRRNHDGGQHLHGAGCLYR